MIDVGKNEFRCLFVGVIGTLHRSLVSINTKQLSIMLNFLSHGLITRKHMKLTKLFENKHKIQKTHLLPAWKIIFS